MSETSVPTPEILTLWDRLTPEHQTMVARLVQSLAEIDTEVEDLLEEPGLIRRADEAHAALELGKDTVIPLEQVMTDLGHRRP